MNPLLSFLPHHLARGILDDPQADPRRAERLAAVVLFADVSGFTPMSEALGRYGQAGTEELTVLLNTYFAVMIDLVASYGGIVSAFGGDALTALFLSDGDPVAVGARAVQCALDMQLLMAPYAEVATSAGPFSLTIKIGVAVGTVLSIVVGDPQIRLQSLLIGPALERAAAAERKAQRGEVLAEAVLLQHAVDLVLDAPRDTVVPVRALRRHAEYQPLPPLPPLNMLSAALEATLTAFVHQALAARLSGGADHFVDEHRSVTVLFVGFGGFTDVDDPGLFARLQAYVAQVAAIVRRYDGDMNKIDTDDKGSKFVIVFGAPVAHENDGERAMHCALALRDLDGPPVRIGIAAGRVYCGLVGSELRREYTVMGDAVNMAARLMQAADAGTILVAETARRPLAQQFAWDVRAPLPVRGRAEPVAVAALLHPLERAAADRLPAYRLPMVGRDDELRAIEADLMQAQAGRGQVAAVSAEAGMGKSRLLAEVIRSAARSGVAVYRGECLSHGVSISYLPWHALLRSLFAIDPRWPPERQSSRLREWAAVVAPHMQARLPLIAAALNVEIAESDLTRSLDARTRKEVLEATLAECLRAEVAYRQGPSGSPQAAAMLLVIEDCHWIDPLSHDLLEVLARAIIDLPVLLLLSYRPPEYEHQRLRVSRLAHFREYNLREFSLRETEWLIGLKFGYLFGAKGVLPAGFVERITTRSQGNPFYIDQMVNYIQDQAINPDDVAALEQVQLPDSLRALIISRIDRLQAGEQIILKVASVVGRVFRASWLWSISPELGQPEHVLQSLATLSKLDLTPLERDAPELEYLFKHVVTQEVAYESLALATRTLLHEQVARLIEARLGDDPERYLDLLAFHYGRSENRAKQRQYFQLAGEAAQAAFANDAAMTYFRRLLPLIEPPEQVPVYLRIAATAQLLGRLGEADSAIRAALALAEQAADPALIARCRTDYAGLLAAQGEYERAIAIIDAVMPIWEQLNNPAGHYDALLVLGYVLIDIGEYTRGLRQLEHTHEIASRLGDEALIARSVGYMGLVYVDIHDDEMALYCLERSVELARRFGDWALLARMQGTIGFVLMRRGELDAAWPLFAALTQQAAEIGDRRTLARIAANIGYCCLMAGDAAAAFQAYAVQLGIDLEVGERRDACIGLGMLAGVFAAIGDDTRALALIELAIGLCDSMRLVYWGCLFRHHLAGLHARQARLAAALQHNDESLAMIRRYGGNSATRFAATLLDLHLRVQSAELSAAAAIEMLQTLDEDWFGLRERAMIQAAIVRLDPQRDDARQAALQALAAVRPTIETNALISELGGVTPPIPPMPALPAAIAALSYDLDALLVQAEQLRDPAAPT